MNSSPADWGRQPGAQAASQPSGRLGDPERPIDKVIAALANETNNLHCVIGTLEARLERFRDRSTENDGSAKLSETPPSPSRPIERLAELVRSIDRATRRLGALNEELYI